ncbi:MAG: hypothetical protein R3344_04995 [Acidobacteriota bacterium]|nr:hypothetical protein [Acidobacteriota bacterium]
MKTREQVLAKQKEMPVGTLREGEGHATLQRLLDDRDAVDPFDQLPEKKQIEITKARINMINERFRITIPGYKVIDRDEAIKCLDSLLGGSEGLDERTKNRRKQVGKLLVELERKIIANVRHAVGAAE